MHALINGNFLFLLGAGTGAVVWGAWRSYLGLIAAGQLMLLLKVQRLLRCRLYLRLQRLGATH